MTSRSLKFVVVFSLMAIMFLGYNPKGADAASHIFTTPAKGSVSSEYDYRWGTFHHGMDFANVRGTAVVASADGVVSRASGGCYEGNQSCNGGFGNVVYIKHTTSSGKVFETVYGHLNSVNVSMGQRVSQGQVIGAIGNTGHSTGPHLHFEVHEGGFSRSPSNSINPRRALNGEFDYLFNWKNPSGIGLATSIYPNGYGINLYYSPNGQYFGKINQKVAYTVNEEQNGWLRIGRVWVQAKHMNFREYTATSKYPNGHGVNIYKSPNGGYNGKISAPTAYKVYDRVEGWIGIGSGAWVKEEHLIIK